MRLYGRLPIPLLANFSPNSFPYVCLNGGLRYLIVKSKKEKRPTYSCIYNVADHNFRLHVFSPGQKCPTPSSSPVDCSRGEYSPLGVSVCIACQDGEYASSVKSATCSVCPAGSACPDKTAAPSSCLTGEYSSAGQQFCTPCASGWYKDSGGAGSCLECPAGYECPTPHNSKYC